MKNSLVETLIGAVVIVIAVVFFTFAYTTGGVGKGSGGYSIRAEFDSVDGITVGSDVRMAGIKIGTVAKQELIPDDFRARLTLSLDPEVKLPTDTSARITSDGLLGGKFVAFEAGGDEEYLKEGDLLEHTQGAIDLFGLINQYLFSDKK